MISIDDFKMPNIGDLNEILGDSISLSSELKAIEKAEKRRYEQEVLQTLKNIEVNTIGLNEITSLLSDNLDKQDELLEFVTESLSISASRSKEEAEGK